MIEPDMVQSAQRPSHGVQSAEIVLQILSAFCDSEPLPMLKTIAARVNMHPAKVHRYLVSLCRAGYVEQDAETSRYRLGSSALRLAFAAMSAVDGIRVARPMLADFCQRLQHTVVLAVWNAGGPTIAARETLPGLLSMTATEGFVLPLLRSSIGAVFAAYLPRERTRHLIKAELEQPTPGAPQTIAEVDAMLESVRHRGLARTTGQLNSGSHSFAAPIFRPDGEIAAVLCALGPTNQFNSNWNSPIGSTLISCAREVSLRLGYSSPR